MESWKKITYVVAIFMFLVETRPLEPYLTAYLTGPNGKISLSEVPSIFFKFLFYEKYFINKNSSFF